jgi:hypothetical protein
VLYDLATLVVALAMVVLDLVLLLDLVRVGLGGLVVGLRPRLF